MDLLDVDAARMASLLNVGRESIETVGGWDVVGPAAVCALGLAVFVYWRRQDFAIWWGNSFYSRWRERRRMWAAEEKKYRELMADEITDMVQRLVDKKELPGAWAYAQFKKLGYHYPDLLRRGETPVKEEIKARIASEPRDAKGNVIPVPFPKEEPAKEPVLQTAYVHLL